MRKVFIYERPNNPAYYDKLSDTLQKLIDEVKQSKTDYKEHIQKLIELVQNNKDKTQFTYPEKIKTDAQKALYDNLDEVEELALAIHNSILKNAMDGWKDGVPPTKKVRRAIAKAMELKENDEKGKENINGTNSCQ